MILVLFMLICGLISTVGYLADKNGRFCFSALCYMFYGSMLMWSVDLWTELKEEGTEALAMSAEDVLDDLQLTASVTALAVTVWALILVWNRFLSPKFTAARA